MNNLINFIEAQPKSNFSIHTLEEKTNFILPENLRLLFKNYSGSIPTIKNKEVYIQFTYKSGDKQSEQIRRIKTPEQIIENWRYRGYLQELFDQFNLDEKFVQTDYLFPFAEMLGHELYCSVGGDHDGKVYAIDNGDFGFAFLAKNLDEFFNRLFVDY